MTRARFLDWTLLDTKPPLFLCIVEVEVTRAAPERYAVVLATAAGDAAQAMSNSTISAVVARLSGARAGILYDGMVDPLIGQTVFDVVRRGGTTALRSGTLHIGHADGATPTLPDDASHLRAHIPSLEQSNSNALIGDRYLLKVFRRLEPGENPDIEIGRRLGARAPEARVPALVAWAEYQSDGATPTSVAMLQQQVPSRGSAWERALDHLQSYCEAVVAAATTGRRSSHCGCGGCDGRLPRDPGSARPTHRRPASHTQCD